MRFPFDVQTISLGDGPNGHQQQELRALRDD
jgi:hypothetical protein